MIEVTLSIRPTSEAQRSAAAWFIAGDDPGLWLDELSRWQISLERLRLYLAPRSSHDRRPCGVLVVPPHGVVPAKTLRAEAYGKCGSHLYLPVMSRLDPPAGESEVDAAVMNDLAVWHPTAGLVGFEEADAIGVADLVEPPVEQSISWNRARPGTAMQQRLLAVIPPPPPPPLEQAVGDWRDDIGGEEPDVLPPAPKEPSDSPLHRLARTAKVAFARLTQKLTALAPRTATAPTWVNRLENWAARQVQLFGDALDAARRKQINRLLHLLDTDPDRGLRHAIPFGGAGYRGEGSPGWQLPTGNVDFSLDRLAGGGPVDRWQLDADQHFALKRRYRELANREVQLGRHRRAAYIFAELLDDLPAAASALEQGGHDREAAVLYRDRLGQPLEAARCLERCGGWDEAIEIYAEQKAFENAAALLARLERPEETAAMYRRAVEHWRGSGDDLRAAKLLEDKLGAVEEAIGLLASAWPSSSQAGICLGELFALFGRHARHDEARRWIARLRDAAPSPVQLSRSVTVLAAVSLRYPNPAVRHDAADAARVLVGNRLPHAESDEASLLVKAVRLLVPQDDLLGRDTSRWMARYRQPPAPSRGKYGPPQKQATIVETGGFRLPGDVVYKAAITIGYGEFLAAGFSNRGITAVVGRQSGQRARIDWMLPFADLRQILLATDGQVAAIGLIGGPPLDWRDLALGVIGKLQRIGTPSWFTRETLAMASSAPGEWSSIDDQLLFTLIRAQGLAVAFQYSSQQISLAELGIRFELRDEPPERLAVMLGRREHFYLGVGHTMVKVNGDRIEQVQLSGWVRQLVAAPLVVQHRIAAAFEDHGAAVIWDDLNGRDVLEIADGLERPELTFTLDGLLIAVNDMEGRVYATSNRSVALRGRFDGPRRPIAAALCGERPSEFALLTEDGTLHSYRID